MARFLLRRIGSACILILVVLTIVFFLVHAVPGDPVQLFRGTRIGPEQLDRLRQLYGLDQPIGIQYLKWLIAMLRGDWGVSMTHQRAVFDVIFDQLPSSVLLIGAALSIEHAVGLPLGILAASRPGTWTDRLVRDVSLLLFSLPIFWLGLMAIEVFAVRWPVFPVGHTGADLGEVGWSRFTTTLYHLALPALTLGLARSGAVTRYIRNGLLEVLAQDYIRNAHALGLSPARILWIHALKNTLGPLVQRLGIRLSMLVSGSLVIEAVFALPGLGTGLLSAVLERDYPVVLGITAVAGVGVVVGNLLADLLFAAIDPRVREEAG